MEKKRKTRAILAGAVVVVAVAAAMAAPKMTASKKPTPPPPIVAVAPPPVAAPQPQPVVAPVQVEAPPAKPKVEVVFVLDTTGSMSGMIRGAKQKIWAMANHIASAQPTPEVKIGLVGYRDIGDAYVTKRYPLSTDLDEVFEHLMAFRADGGGDTPEHVNKALYEAVNKMQWSDGAMKMVFLVGDAPPHTDYNDGYDAKTIARDAGKKEIRIYTIRCGEDPETEVAWKEIAKMGHGTYATIEQSGGVVATRTPMDDELARLGRKLSDTTVIYGDGESHRRFEGKMGAAAGAPASAAADRSGFYSKSGATLDADDITEKAARGEVDVGHLEAAKLPEPMRAMPVEERRSYVAEKKKARDEVMKEMKVLTAKREAYLKEAEGKTPASPTALDSVVNGAITKQAKDYGLKY
jgi:hypothetical protein